MLTLTKFQISEKPMCLGLLTMSNDMEVLAYPDVVVYVSGVQECKPFTSNKFSIGHQVSDTVFSYQSAEAMDKFHSLFGIGVPSLIHHLEDYRKGHAFVDDAESEDVDVSVAELSVCPVHRQGIRYIYRNEL